MAQNSPVFERLALSLLLTSPTTLSRAWHRSNDPTEWETALRQLPLTPDAITEGVRFMKTLAANRDSFMNVREFLTGVYEFPEPHPGDSFAGAIVTMMRKLDGNA